MVISLLLFALLSPGIPHESELKNTVSAYWTLMAKGEKAKAMTYVLPSCQNDFVNRVEPKIRAWSLVQTERVNDKEVVVTVRMEALFKETIRTGGFQSVEKRETWVRDKKSWKLKVTKPSMAAVAPLFSKTDRQLPKVLTIRPSVLHIQFFNKSQAGRVIIQNGTASPAELLSIKFDESRFDLIKRPSHIDAGKTEPLVLRYKGDENDKNLQSQMTVVLKQDGQENLYQVPIVYNYFSDGARALFGLTEEQARVLKRGDKLRPVVKQPAAGASPSPNLPVPPAEQP